MTYGIVHKSDSVNQWTRLVPAYQLPCHRLLVKSKVRRMTALLGGSADADTGGEQYSKQSDADDSLFGRRCTPDCPSRIDVLPTARHYTHSDKEFMFVSANKSSIDAAPKPDTSVLIVDDEEKLGRFISMLLNRVGYHTHACRSVAEARLLITRQAWDLIITDIVMPQENGFELVQWIAQHHPDLPVIVMTAHSTDAVETQAVKLGVTAILHKPFTIDGLSRTISKATNLQCKAAH